MKINLFINMISSGLLGDFIHSLFACKNICEQRNSKADLYISPSHGGDPWRYGVQRAFEDLKEIVLEQSYINSFQIIEPERWYFIEGAINLNDWRKEAFKTRHSTGVYNKSWTQIMMDTYKFNFTGEYKWLATKKVNDDTKNKILIHYSDKRHNENKTVWNDLFATNDKEILFITSDGKEYDAFEFKDKCKLYTVETVSEMAVAINSCSLFVGNQSAPFAIASALDKNRVVELDLDASPFYILEERYSKNISWFLDEERKHYTPFIYI